MEGVKSILLIGLDDEGASELVADELAARFGLKVATHKIPMPHVRSKGTQKNGEDLLNEVSLQKIKLKHDYALGFTTADIFVSGLDLVFGIASNKYKSAVVSTFKLKSPDPAIFKIRILKEAAHEIGHMFGLGHCPEERCAMRFSKSLGDIDMKGAEFCARCGKELQDLSREVRV